MRALSRSLALLGAVVVLVAADRPLAWRALEDESRLAIAAGDYGRLRKALVLLRPLEPGNSRVAYNLAASGARLGDRAAAIAGVRHLAAMGLTYDVAADDDFASLRADADFIAARRQLEANKAPRTQSRLAFTLPVRDALPEDIAFDSRTRRFLVSSVRERRVFFADDGKTFARADWPVMALRIDPARRLLWASIGWLPHCGDCQAADRDKTALIAFDLDTGKQKRRIASPLPGLLGDMTISAAGDLHVSEGIHGAVLHLRAGGDVLERIDPPGELPSPQTPLVSRDGKTLYVADYLRGIAAIDLATRAMRFLQPSDDIALNGIDGLYADATGFIAVQNGTQPPRIIHLSDDLTHQEILESGWPGLGEPTHGVLVDGAFYFIANAGWDAYDHDGHKKAGVAPVESTVRIYTPMVK